MAMSTFVVGLICMLSGKSDTRARAAWLTTLNMDVYLLECSDVKAWQELVQTLYRFEEGNSINGVCIIYYKYMTGLTNFLSVEFTNCFTSRRSCDLD